MLGNVNYKGPGHTHGNFDLSGSSGNNIGRKRQSATTKTAVEQSLLRRKRGRQRDRQGEREREGEGERKRRRVGEI